MLVEKKRLGVEELETQVAFELPSRELKVFSCDHNYPILVTPTETGRYYARCLACLTAGPERPSSEAARNALQIPGASRELQARGVEASARKRGRGSRILPEAD
jgi:hypothetical protein